MNFLNRQEHLVTQFIQRSFNQYLSHIYYLLGTVLRTRNVMVNKAKPVSPSLVLCEKQLLFRVLIIITR